ncbi:type II CAAX endopeptidase family protein [Aquimarina sp. 2201CG5-10]|uniref:CPBP family intramembrane glutamic endopeptidase n=1 Tax=Aquimarina callyspongiae TaxID=3098150 RepID=UPI002AB50752|nr:type II CAAX endopeptidase family protein [Aquimarina sp. 2201CG5-10]MDY8135865.1 type II CAAX endopeptidase family protein [Aquimarina sp. 2201CG5-10]
MKNQEERNLVEKIMHFPITKIVIGIITCILTTYLVKAFITTPLLSLLIPSETIVKTIVALIGTIVMTATYYYLFKYYEKRQITELSFKHAFKELFGGFGFGILVIGAEFLILYFLGNYEITGYDKNFTLFSASLAFLIGAAMLEEIIFRGVLYRILENWKGTVIAVLISGVIFQIPHFMNPNESIIGAIAGMLFGMLMGIMYTYTRRLWLPFSFHLGWNLAQPIFGSNLTGLDQFGVFFNAEFQGSTLLTGSAMGIEDSLLTLGSLVILLILFYKASLRKKHVIPRLVKSKKV